MASMSPSQAAWWMGSIFLPRVPVDDGGVVLCGTLSHEASASLRLDGWLCEFEFDTAASRPTQSLSRQLILIESISMHAPPLASCSARSDGVGVESWGVPPAPAHFASPKPCKRAREEPEGVCFRVGTGRVRRTSIDRSIDRLIDLWVAVGATQGCSRAHGAHSHGHPASQQRPLSVTRLHPAHCTLLLRFQHHHINRHTTTTRWSPSTAQHSTGTWRPSSGWWRRTGSG